MASYILLRAPLSSGARHAPPHSSKLLRNMAKKLYIKTHGCQMNEYDSSRMADLLRTGETVEMTDTPDDADILLLNTCSIREKAQEKVFHQLGRWKKLKSKKPEMIIG